MSGFWKAISIEYCCAQLSFAAYSNGCYLRIDKFKPSNFSASWSAVGSSSSLSASSSSACSSKINNENILAFKQRIKTYNIYIDMFENYLTGMIYTEHVYQSASLQKKDN